MVLLDAAVPVLVGAVITGAAVLDGNISGRPLPLVLGWGAALSLLARRRAPLGTVAVSAALVVVAVHLNGRVGPVAVLAPAVALFSVSLTRGRGQQVVAAAAAVGMVIAADVFLRGGLGLVPTLGHVALLAVPMLAAEALRTRRSYVALLVERLALAERSREQEAERRVQQERMRIARDLHDVVAHTLTTINVQAGTAAALIAEDPAYARGALQLIEEASREATAELRAIVGVLRDRDAVDAPRAPAPGLDCVADLVARSGESGLSVTLKVSGEPPRRLPDAVSLAGYRIVQESLTNVHRHAATASVCIRLEYGEHAVSVSVQNDSGLAASPSQGGVGIIGMRERAEALGGSLRAGSLPGGFRVEAELPYTLGPA